jgi:MFS family permease
MVATPAIGSTVWADATNVSGVPRSHRHGHRDRAAGGRHDTDHRLGLTLAAASTCIFVVQLDFFALNLALPTMAVELDTSTTNMQWVISGFMLALGAALIPGGRLGDILGRKRTLIVGLTIFGGCSLGAGLASSASVVIAFRIVQGVGAGIMFPLAIAVITAAFPPERTMRAIGNAYGLGAVAEALGPVFGGGLTQVLGWRVVLLVNVPTCLAAIAVVAWGVRESRDTTVPRTIDLPGLVTVVVGIAAVTYALDRVNTWPPAATVGLAAGGLLVLVAFVLRERMTRWPLVSLDLFRNMPYVLVTLMAMVANIAFVVTTFLVTIYLQRVDGYSPATAGMIFLAASVAAGVAGPLSGRLGERFNVPRTVAAATVVGAAGLLVVSLGGGLGRYVPGLALVGLGYGIGWAMASVGTQTVVPPERAGQASGVTLAIVIGAAGLAVAGAAVLVEAGSGRPGAADLGMAIESLLRWLALASAVAAGILGLLAARLIPRRHSRTAGTSDLRAR